MPQFDALYGPALNLELNSSDSNTLFTTARRQQGINDGLQEFADLTECYIRQSSITVSCNTLEYLLSGGALANSTDFSRFSAQGLEYRVRSSGATPTWITWLTGDEAFPQRPIEWRNAQMPGWRQSTNPVTPTGYYLRPDGGNVYLGLDAPPNVGSSQHAEVTVPYIARPVQLSASTDVPFTSTSGQTRTDLTIFHQATVHYAAYKLLPLIGDEQGSQSQLQKFMGYVTRYLQQHRPKGGQQVRFAHNYLKAARGGSRSGRWDRPSLIPPSQWS